MVGSSIVCRHTDCEPDWRYCWGSSIRHDLVDYLSIRCPHCTDRQKAPRPKHVRLVLPFDANSLDRLGFLAFYLPFSELPRRNPLEKASLIESVWWLLPWLGWSRSVTEGLVGREFWDLLGGKGTYTQLVSIFVKVFRTRRRALD